MDKKDLMNLLQTKMEHSQGTVAEGEAITGLRITIALVEIRGSLDALRRSIDDGAKKLDDVAAEIALAREKRY